MINRPIGLGVLLIATNHNFGILRVYEPTCFSILWVTSTRYAVLVKRTNNLFSDHFPPLKLITERDEMRKPKVLERKENL